MVVGAGGSVVLGAGEMVLTGATFGTPEEDADGGVGGAIAEWIGVVVVDELDHLE